MSGEYVLANKQLIDNINNSDATEIDMNDFDSISTWILNMCLHINEMIVEIITANIIAKSGKAIAILI